MKEKSCLFCILSPVSLLPRALHNQSDHIDILSTQHRLSKGSRRLTKAQKPGSFRKWIPIRRVYNRMDKLTLTRGISKELECNNIDSYRRKMFSIDSNDVPMGYG
ncbi:hypothetical protein ES288_D08G177000v1 [Gossypium darwinii]|uniref:Uncharacterized protein n=1 Tax=Gossypium darwinii TaxID=34276 RepID=A0A5D2BKE1_GOSDA|nr:hypothetical protein ES288_D08G177000v1 [Gossypium darwinii]